MTWVWICSLKTGISLKEKQYSKLSKKKSAVLKLNWNYNQILREMFTPLAKPAVCFRQAVSHFPWNVFLVPFISKANFHKFYLTSVNSGLSSVCYTFSLLTSNYQYHPTEVPKTEPNSLWGSDWNPYVLSTTNLLEESVPFMHFQLLQTSNIKI